MIHKTTGLVIQAIDYGETHRILTLLNPQGYKIPMMARGAKKVPSKFTSVAQPFVEAEFVYARSGGMGTLQHADLINSYPNLRMDLLATSVAAWSTEMTNRILGEEPGGTRIYRDLRGLWQQLNAQKDPLVLSAIFEMKMIGSAGYAPQLNHCNRCRTSEHLSYLSVPEGGAICTTCARLGADQPVSPRGLHWIKQFADIDLELLGDIQLRPETVFEIRRLIRWWWDEQLGGQWKTRNVLDQLTEGASICYIPTSNRRDERNE